MVSLGGGVELATEIYRLEVSSKNLPRFKRNSKTGGGISTEPWHQYLSSVNRVSRDARHPNQLILSIIEP